MTLWKEHLDITKVAKLGSDVLEISEDTGLQSHRIIGHFYGGGTNAFFPYHTNGGKILKL